jgi:hypothetical protein
VADGAVFINYRTEDSHSYGALLYSELSRRFGPELVFRDAESIPAGADYVERLLGRVRQARVVLAVIGTQWLTAAGPGGRRRIDDPEDWVRRELVAAFAAGVRVVPVLTDEAPVPTEGQLPQELEQLGRCQFRRLRHRDTGADIARLAADLAEADAELATALQRGPYGAPEPVCPYPGMVAFGPGEAPFFHGRERLIGTLLARLGIQVRRGGGPLVVVGPSGVGKSSLLRAGLLPALAAGDLRTLHGHKSGVLAVAFSPDGSTLATASWDNTARLWNVHTHKPTAVLDYHSRGVLAVAFSPDGTTLATGSDDDTAWLWNARTGQAITALRGHTDAVTAVAFSPDSTTLATSSDDHTTRLWNAHTVRLTAGHTGGVLAVAFSPDSTTFATGSDDDTARLWNVHTGEPITALRGHTDAVKAVGFSPDGTTLATASSDSTVRLWNARTGQPITTPLP